MSEETWSEKQVEDLIQGFVLSLIREYTKKQTDSNSEEASS